MQKSTEAEKEKEHRLPLRLAAHGSPEAFLGNGRLGERLFQTNVGSTGVENLGTPAWIFVHHAKNHHRSTFPKQREYMTVSHLVFCCHGS